MAEQLAIAIDKTRKNIRKKHRLLQVIKHDEKFDFQKTFEPIIKPLREMSEKTKEEQKSEEPEEIPEASVSEVQEIPQNSIPKPIILKKSILGTRKRSRLDVSSLSTTLPPSKNFRLQSPSTTSSSSINNNDRESSNDEYQDVTNNDRMEIDQTLNKFGNVSLADINPDETLPVDLYENPDSAGKKYLNTLYKSQDYDEIYGPKWIDNKLKIGNKELKILTNDDIKVGGKKYTGSQGLYELLFLSTPNRQLISPSDLINYYDILHYSSAHKIQNNPNLPLISSSKYKYTNFIRPNFKKTGTGLKFVATNKKLYYKYWDNPNELLKRLKLLVGEKKAGNNIHDQEIHSILTELLQKKYIIRKSRFGS